MTGSIILQQPGLVILVLSLLSIAPFLIVTSTAFIKLSAVFSILRSALGTPQIPPNVVITGLSLVLTILIMMPVGVEFQGRLKASGLTWSSLNDPGNYKLTIESVQHCLREPLINFLKKHAHDEEKEMILRISEELNPGNMNSDNLMVLVTAFILSELKEAFQIGFLLFLPFIIIDMVVANVLQAFGMVMLSPTTISLPFKLLLFVLADGWYLVTEGLIKGYL